MGSIYAIMWKRRLWVRPAALKYGGFSDETFLVISEDALTDLDLSKAVEFHKDRAPWPLVLTRVGVTGVRCCDYR